MDKSSEADKKTVPKPPTRRRPKQVRARILKSALNIFAIHGFEGASVRGIAAAAHVSISLLIYHFGSKEELWQATIKDVFAKAVPSFEHDPAFHGAATAAERLSILIEQSVRLFAEYPALHRLMTLEGHQPTDRLIWLCDTYIAENYKMVCEMIADGQREGAVVDGDPAQLRMAITAMAAVPFSVSAEYQYLTKHNPFAKNEIEATIALIKRLIFKAD